MIVIAGHADERGTREYNLALGERHATTVRIMVAKGNSARVRTVSYGKSVLPYQDQTKRRGRRTGEPPVLNNIPNGFRRGLMAPLFLLVY